MTNGKGEVLNPVDVEHEITRVSNEIAIGVRVVSEREGLAKQARRVYDLAFAQAFLAAEGAANSKKYKAEVATAQQRADAEVAEVAFEHAKRQAKALEGRLSAFQSIYRGILAMFSGAYGKGN